MLDRLFAVRTLPPPRTCAQLSSTLTVSRVLGFVFVLGLTLAASACGPMLNLPAISSGAVWAERETQREIAFSVFMDRQHRLRNVSYPLLVAGAEFCQGAVRPTYGFVLHNKNLYGDYEQVAARHYGIGDELSVRYVHPQLPAASAGLRVGDRVLAINNQSLQGKGVAEAIEIVGADRSVLLRIERDGYVRDLMIEAVPACRYPVQLIDDQAINAAADGSTVLINTGMMRFATKDEELALIVGHEIAHNALGHIPKKTGNYLLGTIVDAAIAGLLDVDTQNLFGKLGAQVFSQAFEAEADYGGLYMVARAGYDITNAANFWRRMAVEHPGSMEQNFLATHPSTPERFLAIQNAVREIEEKKRLGRLLSPQKKGDAWPRRMMAQQDSGHNPRTAAVPTTKEHGLRPHVEAARKLPQSPQRQTPSKQETSDAWLLGAWEGEQVWSGGAGQRARIAVEFKEEKGTLVWELLVIFRGAKSKASGSAKVTGEGVTMAGRHVAGPAAGAPLLYTLTRKGDILQGTGLARNVPLQVSWRKVK